VLCTLFVGVGVVFVVVVVVMNLGRCNHNITDQTIETLMVNYI
jgi:hypothetical protein